MNDPNQPSPGNPSPPPNQAPPPPQSGANATLLLMGLAVVVIAVVVAASLFFVFGDDDDDCAGSDCQAEQETGRDSDSPRESAYIPTLSGDLDEDDVLELEFAASPTPTATPGGIIRDMPTAMLSATPTAQFLQRTLPPTWTSIPRDEPLLVAPSFALDTFDGDTFRLDDYLGENVIVLNFAGSWCPPCHQEAPTLERIYRDYQSDGVVFVGVFGNDTEPAALEYIEDYAITYPTGLDAGNRIADQYRVTGYPETFVINRAGEVVAHVIAPVSDMRLRDTIEEALE